MISVRYTLFLDSFSRMVERVKWINREYHTGFCLFLEQSRVSSRPWNDEGMSSTLRTYFQCTVLV